MIRVVHSIRLRWVKWKCFSWIIKFNHFECGGEINVLVKSRRDVHNFHEINGIFTLVQKQSCAISSVTRNSFRNSVIGKWRKSEFWPSGWGGGRNINERLYCDTCWSASWAMHFFYPWFTLYKVKSHSDRKYPLFVI